MNQKAVVSRHRKMWLEKHGGLNMRLVELVQCGKLIEC